MRSILENIYLFKTGFIENYGRKKYDQISSKVYSSSKIAKLISASNIKLIAPNKNDFLYALNETIYFIFSKPDTLAMGSILAFELWHKTLNADYSYLNEVELNIVFEGIIEECEKMKLRK